MREDGSSPAGVKPVRNPAQREAIAHLTGPMLVLAGPGSGKTSVIVERTARMTGQAGIAPASILVVTFSRMAAEEMKKRFLDYIGRDATSVTFGTFHSVFFFILSQAYGLTPANILREEEKYKILRGLLTQYGEDQMLEGDFLADLLKEISTVKGNRISLEHVHAVCCPDEVFRNVYRAYVETTHRRRKLDFDDMLLDCYELFVRRPDILEQWRKRFVYILVDEFQDINPLQYDILRLLAAPGNNLFAVGDDDQSIYHFRGASPEIMLHFEKDFPGARRVLLNVNYRCTGNILETASTVIRKNQKRFPKKLSTPNGPGRPVAVSVFRTPQEEYRHIVSELKRRMDAGEDLTDTAVLFRTNQEAEGLVHSLMDVGIPFVMRDALPNVYEHWASVDVLAYLELARAWKQERGLLPRDRFVQVMNRPNRYISREAVAAGSVSVPGGGLRVDLLRLAGFYEEKDWMRERVSKLLDDLRLLSSLPPFAAVNYVREGVGYGEYLTEYSRLRGQSEEELLQVLDRLQESARSVASLEVWEESIRSYRENLSLQIRRQRQQTPGVTLATLHASKGLEYERVYICNVNEGSIPYKKAVLPEAVEEERRLFYVGMTRAKSSLTLCLTRRWFQSSRQPSRFLMEAGYNQQQST